MFDRLVRKRESIFDGPIDKVLNEMKQYSQDDKEYLTAIENLERLTKMKAEERRHRVSPDTMAIVAGNLFGILIMVAYEHSHVMTSKALGFVIKARESH